MEGGMRAFTGHASIDKHRLVRCFVIGIAATVAILSARSCASSWNDGSRLATVECLVDYHTLAIDESIFVNPPRLNGAPPPYVSDEPFLLVNGTADKLFIKGRYYSDKSPVPGLVMAAVYQVYEWCTGWTARTHTDSFCYWMTVTSSGVAYVVAVWCMYEICEVLGLSLARTLAVTASFSLATVALAYVRQVNNHILLLATFSAMLLALLRQASQGTPASWKTALWIGTLAGLSYTIDLGAGPVMLMCTGLLAIYRFRRVAPVAGVVVGALPWLALHHAVNYAVGGTWKPANAVAEYFNWPGCPFNQQNMTGSWNHSSIPDFAVYALSMQIGKRGFLDHNLALFMAVPAVLVLLRCRLKEKPELIYAGFCGGGTWLLYALTSNNHSGLCCSIRWFVPLLAPGYLALALLLRQSPQALGAFIILSAWGVVEGALMWSQGPWMSHLLPYYWELQGAALASLLAYWAGRQETRSAGQESVQSPPYSCPAETPQAA
jgi:hypothetical protein